MHSESAREQLHAKWLPSGTDSLPSGLCQLSQVLKGARVIMCGEWKPLATSRAGPSQSRCSLGAGVLCQIMCRLNPEYIWHPRHTQIASLKCPVGVWKECLIGCHGVQEYLDMSMFTTENLGSGLACMFLGV